MLVTVAAGALGVAACSPQASAPPPPSAPAPPPVPAVTPAPADLSQSGLEQMVLSIRSHAGEHRFTVEVARTLDQQEKGLMFRTALAGDRGMIFPYDPPQSVAFWMKHTLIPLDMIFIRADGTIARVAENRQPETLDPVPAGEPIAAVLEIAGGRSAELGIRAGDVVTWQH